MPQPARVLGVADARRLLRRVRTHRHPSRDTVIILLSFKAGLRACEIAGLDWSMVLRPDATLGQQIAVANRIAKNGSGRIIPLHRDLRGALAKLHMEQSWPRAGPIIQSERGGHMTARSIVNWFAGLYAALDSTAAPHILAAAPSSPVRPDCCPR